jgi:hypothetical protein
MATTSTGSASSRQPPFSDTAARTPLVQYKTLEDGQEATVRLQTAGLWAVLETETEREQENPGSRSKQRRSPSAVVLCVRNRDTRKARGILRAFHLLPDDAPSSRPSSLGDAGKKGAIDGRENHTGPSQERIPDGENEDADASEEPSAGADWMPHVRFGHMVIGGAVLLALATVLFLWLSASAG